MEEFNTYEYSVEHSKKDKKLKLKKTLLLIFYTVYCITGLTFAAVAPVGALVATFIALVPVSCWIISFFTWRYVKPEYVYSMTSGVLTFTILYGNRTKKKIFETKIASAETVAPYTEKSKHDIEKYAPKNEYFGVSSLTSPDAYYMLFQNDKGENCVYYFEATARALKILRFYNQKTEVTAVRF